MRIIVSLLVVVAGALALRSSGCSEKGASLAYNRPIYEFSMNILHRVALSERGSFVFSPISTWLQLLHLYEGSGGNTAVQLQTVVGKGNACFKNKIQRVIRQSVTSADDLLKSYMVLDELLDVKPEYKAKLESQGLTELVTVNFNNPSKAVDTVSRVTEDKSNDVSGLFDEEDFKKTVLLLFDIVNLRIKFATPFNPSETRIEPFFTNWGAVQTQTISQIGIFNVTKLPTLNVSVLELPCDLEDRIKMLLIQTEDIADVFTVLSMTRLKGIFNSFKQNGETTVRISLPRFQISSYVDNIPELLYDMGVSDVFDPDLSNLKGISDYKLYASSMKQMASLRVEEGAVTTVQVPGLQSREDVEQFNLNKPFGFLVVDKMTEVVLLAGVYATPGEV